ncbi:MAG: ATP-grasp domain-containing protein, partial [Aureliella sp.]
ELVDLLHHHFTLLGPTVDQLRQLRSPEYWYACATAAGIDFPETHWRGIPAADDGLFNTGVVRESAEGPTSGMYDWLLKPRRGAGGHAIRRATGKYTSSCSIPDSHYLQRKIAGRSLGVYCILHSNGQAELLGATESLTAEQWPGPSEFIYRGSVGSICLTDTQRQQILRLCQVIQSTSDCRGWLQFDFIEDDSGALWLLELNPRWAAGMEILFLAGINPVAYHCRAWQSPRDPAISESNMATLSRTDTQFAKAVVYADRELTLTPERIERLHRLPRASFADLPSHSNSLTSPPTKIVNSGSPLLTVRASGPPELLLEQMLQLRKTALVLCHS